MSAYRPSWISSPSQLGNAKYRRWRRLPIDLRPAFIVAIFCPPAAFVKRAGFLAWAVPDLHVKIIFFLTPTPTVTARSYSTGTIAQS
jgi:hypothetical protein